jgi:plastocyanin
MKKITFLVSIFLFAFLALPASAATPVETLKAGDLIRSESFSAVYYYGEDGMRYVFPNDKTYFTWYSNFNNVKWLSDSDMSTVQIGGNVTYKPGVKMIKIKSDPKVYTVSKNGLIRAVGSEAVAKTLYGNSWASKVDDMPDGFFSNYSIGSPIELEGQFSRDAETNDALNIDDDKSLQPVRVVNISNQEYDTPTIVINSGTAVRWVNKGTSNESATEWDETWGSGTLKPGEHFTKYFKKIGTWSYYSKYTPTTKLGGSVIVK